MGRLQPSQQLLTREHLVLHGFQVLALPCGVCIGHLCSFLCMFPGCLHCIADNKQVERTTPIMFKHDRTDLALAVADLQSKADEAELQSLQTAGTSAEAKALVTRLRREGRSSEAEAAAAELRASLVRAHSAVSEGLRYMLCTCTCTCTRTPMQCTCTRTPIGHIRHLAEQAHRLVEHHLLVFMVPQLHVHTLCYIPG